MQYNLVSMHKTIVLFVISICFFNRSTYAQNAFYDAVRINNYIKNNNFTDAIPILLNYHGKGQTFNWNKYCSKYPDHMTAIKEQSNLLNYMKVDKLLEDQSSMENLLKNILVESPQIKNFKLAVTQYFKSKNKYTLFDQEQKFLLSQNDTTLIGSLTNIGKSFERLNETKYFDSVTQVMRDSLDVLEAEGIEIVLNDKKTIVTGIFMEHIQHEKNKAEILMDEEHEIISSLILEDDVYYAVFKESSKSEERFDLKLSTSLKSERQQMAEAIQVANASPSNNFRLPSQSEMIDALAIYLAKRVKQEVSIQFIEKLSVTIRDHIIMSELFPNTLALLNNRDAYARPNFGTSWQIALSEDFIKIPENITKCLPSRYQPMGMYIDDGVRISQLVQQHYSFPEAVNLLYSEPLKVPALRNSNSFIYIINHEFYNKNEGSNYWISAEQLQKLDKNELEWLYILLDIRYGDSLNTIMNKTWLGKSVWKKEYFQQKIYPLRNWLTRVLVQFNHFEQELKQDKPLEKGQALSGYWKFQNELMDVILDSNFINLNSRTSKAISFTRGVFTIYSGIEQKNYAAVVDQVLKLLSLLEIDKQASLQDVFFTRQYYSAFKKKEVSVQNLISKQLDELNANYDKLIHSNDLAELEETYMSIMLLLNERGRKESTNFKASPEQFSDKIIHLLQQNGRGNLDSILFKQAFLNEVENDKSRNGELIKLRYRLKNRYAQLDYLNQLRNESLQTFDSLQHLLKIYDLDQDKYFKIAFNKQTSFAQNKLFNFQSPLFNTFLNRIEGRNQYQKIRTAMSFMSDVMQSGNSQDLSRVIEAYSLPPSSYKLKRHSRFTINLDALVGGYIGVEFIKNKSNVFTSTMVGGLSAPIGISMSWGKRSILNGHSDKRLVDGEAGFVNRRGKFKKLEGYNLTLQMNVIDIGAAVSYRISGNTEGGLPSDAKWSQVFSPGLMALVGIKGMPLCIGTGARFTPKLRNIGGDLQRNAFRYDIGLYFDLPLMNVFYR